MPMRVLVLTLNRVVRGRELKTAFYLDTIIKCFDVIDIVLATLSDLDSGSFSLIKKTVLLSFKRKYAMIHPFFKMYVHIYIMRENPYIGFIQW